MESKLTSRARLRPSNSNLRRETSFSFLTDGVTEAMRGRAIFDIAGVRAVLEKAGGKTAEQVMTEMFTELEGFEVTDDATVLLIRQLEVEID